MQWDCESRSRPNSADPRCLQQLADAILGFRCFAPSASIVQPGKRNFAGRDRRTNSGAERRRTAGIRFADRPRPANLPELRGLLSPEKPGRFVRTGWWIIPGSNRGPHHDALWNSRFDIRLWEAEFRAQRLPGEFDGRALQLPKNSGQR